MGHEHAGTPWSSARNLAYRLATPLGAEQVALRAAHGRVLAGPVPAAASVPGYDAAAMDGFAVAGVGPWRVLRDGAAVLAGRPGRAEIAPGTAVEIATGAVVPAGAEAVLPYERCRLTGATLTAPHLADAHIRWTAEDFRLGDVVAHAGQEATAALIGLAAHAGIDDLVVRRRPRVRLLVTGDELVRHGLPARGQVRDALGPMLALLLERAGATVEGPEPVADGHDALAGAIRAAPADVVVVTGSSSVGRADHLRPVLRATGARLHVDGVACRPGHPQVLARSATGVWVVGLPGNPYAGLVGHLTLVEPLLHGLLARARRPAWVLPVDGAVRPLPGATRLVPVELDGARASMVADARPASLGAAAGADAIAVVEPDWTAGAPTELLRLP